MLRVPTITKKWEMRQYEAGNDIDWHNSTAKNDIMVQAFKNGKWTAASKDDAQFHKLLGGGIKEDKQINE